MSIVEQQEVCAHCGGLATYEIQTRTGEERLFCTVCGHFETNEGGQVVVHQGHGAYALFGENGCGSIGSLDEGGADDFKAFVLSSPEITSAYLTLPPHFRRQYLAGPPEGVQGLDPQQEQALRQFFSEQGETLAAAHFDKGYGAAYGRNEHGLVEWRLWSGKDGKDIEISRPGDFPTEARIHSGVLVPERHPH